jgi:hypothetical protein
VILAFVIISLALSLWAFGASQAAWRKVNRFAPPLETRGATPGFDEVAHVFVDPDPLLEEEQYAEVLQDSEVQQYADKEWNNMIANAQAYQCNSCREIKRNTPEFMTKVDLEIPFLDGQLPITVYLCEVCVGSQAQH